ncbi:MAG TPA: universal stress protein [Candidatus Tectomicrobia bacterium]|nr:universal stress protein [Candidatus Tectomicrobia bacterium]
MEIKTVMVPLDGSVLAEAALSPAVDLALKSNARLVLLRAAEAHTGPLTDAVAAQVEAVREAEEYLAGVRERVARAGVTAVETSVWYGPPAEAIIEAATFRDADLIVMSTHGRTGLGRLVLGSVAESVLRGTAVPILVIRPGNAPLATPFTGAPGAREVSHV